jgi:hypothetical protein
VRRRHHRPDRNEVRRQYDNEWLDPSGSGEPDEGKRQRCCPHALRFAINGYARCPSISGSRGADEVRRVADGGGHGEGG